MCLNWYDTCSRKDMFQCRILGFWRPVLLTGICQNGLQDLAMRTVSSSLMMVGILGIFSFLYHCLFLFYRESRLRSWDVILRHLIILASWSFPFTCVPKTLAAISWNILRCISECTSVFCPHNAGRVCSLAPAASSPRDLQVGGD